MIKIEFPTTPIQKIILGGRSVELRTSPCLLKQTLKIQIINELTAYSDAVATILYIIITNFKQQIFLFFVQKILKISAENLASPVTVEN